MDKIVYVGPIQEGSSCLARMRALEEMNLRVYPYDPFQILFNGRPRWQRGFEGMCFWGPVYTRMNYELNALCEKVKPSFVWIDKGFWVWPSTIKKFRTNGIFLIHHNTDAMSPHPWKLKWYYYLIRKAQPLYNMYFTTNLEDYVNLASGFSDQVELTYIGYDHRRFDNTSVSEEIFRKWENDLLFVGHYEPRTEVGIMALAEAGLKISVYGDGWNHAKNKKHLSSYVHFRKLTNEEYVDALKSAKIGLGFVSEVNANQTAGRSFEIPACGTFLLALRTNQHKECYLEGHEAEFFSDINELIEKAKYYLEHDEEREIIAKRGNEKCLIADYSWAGIIKKDWVKIEDGFRDWKSTNMSSNKFPSVIND